MSDETTQPIDGELDSETKAPESEVKTDEGKGKVPSGRLREEADKRRKAEEEKLTLEEELKKQREEFEGYKKEASLQREKDVAIATRGEDIINDEKVQEYKGKYEDMTYEEAIRLAGKEPKKSTATPAFIGRNPKDLLKSDTEYNRSDIVKLPKHERLDIQRRAKSGEVKIIM